MLKDYINNKPTIESERLIPRLLIKSDVEDLREWTPNKEIYKFWDKNPGKNDLKLELMFEKSSKSFHLGITIREAVKTMANWGFQNTKFEIIYQMLIKKIFHQ